MGGWERGWSPAPAKPGGPTPNGHAVLSLQDRPPFSLGVSSLPARHPAAHSGCSTSIICHLLNLRGRLSHLGGRAAGSGESWVCNLIQTFPRGHVNWLLHACSFVDKPGFYENTAALSRTLWDAGNRNPHLSWRVHPPRKSLILRNRKSKGGLCS